MDLNIHYGPVDHEITDQHDDTKFNQTPCTSSISSSSENMNFVIHDQNSNSSENNEFSFEHADYAQTNFDCLKENGNTPYYLLGDSD